MYFKKDYLLSQLDHWALTTTDNRESDDNFDFP